MKWSSKSLGSSFQHAVFLVLIRCRLMPVARALLALVVGYYAVLPGVRARSTPYIRRRFPNAGGFAAWRHTWRLYKCFGDILLERMVAGVNGRFNLIPSPEHFQCFVQALGEGKGCIALSAHVGAWQTGMAALECLNVPMALLHYRDPGDVDKHYFERSGGGRVRIINSAAPFGGMVECAAALANGELVCIMGDRLRTPSEPALEVNFMGEPARFPLFPYVLASITGTPIVITFALREPDGGIRGQCCGILRVPEGLRRQPEKILPFVTTFTQAVEQMATEYPYQFFNFYDMWDNNETAGNT